MDYNCMFGVSPKYTKCSRVEFLQDFFSCGFSPVFHSIQKCWVLGFLYLADDGVGMSSLLKIYNALKVMECLDCLYVIDAKREPAQPQAHVLPDNGMRCKLERGLTWVGSFFSYAKPSSLLIFFIPLDLKHGWGAAADNWWRSLLNN